jgi:hypothetical protein
MRMKEERMSIESIQVVRIFGETNRWVAHINRDPRKVGSGNTPEEAIGDAILSAKDVHGFKVDLFVGYHDSELLH